MTEDSLEGLYNDKMYTEVADYIFWAKDDVLKNKEIWSPMLRHKTKYTKAYLKTYREEKMIKLLKQK